MFFGNQGRLQEVRLSTGHQRALHTQNSEPSFGSLVTHPRPLQMAQTAGGGGGGGTGARARVPAARPSRVAFATGMARSRCDSRRCHGSEGHDASVALDALANRRSGRFSVARAITYPSRAEERRVGRSDPTERRAAARTRTAWSRREGQCAIPIRLVSALVVSAPTSAGKMGKMRRPHHVDENGDEDERDARSRLLRQGSRVCARSVGVTTRDVRLCLRSPLTFGRRSAVARARAAPVVTRSRSLLNRAPSAPTSGDRAAPCGVARADQAQPATGFQR